MKTVYWQIVDRTTGGYRIEFWTKPDRSNKIAVTMVTIEEEKLRKRIEIETGAVRFGLVQTKGK